MKTKTKIGDEIASITISRTEANFDRACDEAYRLAAESFDIDEYGHSEKIEGWERSCCWVEMKYVDYVRTGGSDHVYKFTARTCKADEEE